MQINRMFSFFYNFSQPFQRHKIYGEILIVPLSISYNIMFTDCVVVSEEVKAALTARKPVVALETTIITHGMPHPHNIRYFYMKAF